MVVLNKYNKDGFKIKILVSFLPGILEEAKKEAVFFNLNVIEEFENFFLSEGKIEDIILYLYKSQIPTNILLFYKKVFLDEEENINFLFEEKFSFDFFDSFSSFKVKRIVGEKYYESVLGRQLYDFFKNNFFKNKNFEVDFKTPDFTIGFLQFENNFYLGFLLNDKELYKREYKVYNIPNSLNPAVVASLLYFSNVKDELLVLKCGDGMIPIEFYFKQFKDSVRRYDKENLNLFFFKIFFSFDAEVFLEEEDKSIEVFFKKNFKANKNKIFCVDDNANHLQRAKQNSRLANAERIISFSKLNLDFLILKFESKIRNVIVKHPFLSKHFAENKYKNYSRKLFEELEHIIFKEGFLTIVSNEFEELKKVIGEFESKKSFVLKKYKSISRGDLKLYFVLLQKK